MKELVAVNGQVMKPEDAKISVFDRGFLFGDAVYEVTRSYGKVFFQFEAHIDRLFRSAEWLKLDLGKTADRIIQEIYSIYKEIGEPNYYMRLQVTRGEGPIGMDPSLAGKPNYVLYFKPFEVPPKEYYTEGVDIAVTERLRNSKRSLDPNIKSGNYLNNVLAFIEGKEFRPYESVMMNSEGFITEGCTSNIQIVQGDTIVMTPDEFDILRGITRSLVEEVANTSGIQIQKRGFTAQELFDADEVFITSSTREIMPVKSANGKKTGKRSTVVRALQEGYKKKIEEYSRWAESHHPWN